MRLTLTLRPRARAAALAALLLTGACVTINVNFPAAAADKAADRIIDQVYGTHGSAPAAPVPAPAAAPAAAPKQDDPNQGAHLAPAGAPPALLGRLLDFVVAPARADAPDLDVSTPAIRALVASMEGRHSALEPYYASGAVGLTAEGTLELRDMNAVPLAERTVVRKLVSDENGDRVALYTEIARANGHAEWTASIRTSFARRWIDKARSGWYYRDGGAWKRK